MGPFRLTLSLVVIAVAAFAWPASAAAVDYTFTVDTFADDALDETSGDHVCGPASGAGPCSLRAAAIEVSGGTGYSATDTVTIVLDAGEYRLTRGDDGSGSQLWGDINLLNNAPVTIEGAGAHQTVVRQTVESRVFHTTAPGSGITLRDLAVTGGRPDGDTDSSLGGSGGGIRAEVDLTLERALVFGNSANPTDSLPEVTGIGGGVYSAGGFTMHDSTIAGNAAQSAGGLWAGGSFPVEILNNRIEGNTAFRVGGADLCSIAQVEDTAIKGNTSTDTTFGAGGLSLCRFDLQRLRRVEVSGNTGSTGGISTGGRAALGNVTVSGNRATGGVFVGAGIHVTSPYDEEIDLYNVTVTGNMGDGPTAMAHAFFPPGTDPPEARLSVFDGNCDFTVVATRNNYESGDTCLPTPLVNGNTQNADLLLGPLADNGGPTLTHMPGAGSDVINAGARHFGLDQRSAMRPPTGSDAGAVEVGGALLPAPSPAPPSGSAPANVTRPETTGDASPGDTLSCSLGSWSGDVTSYARQWLRDGAAIGGETRTTYAVGDGDAGRAISCRVTAMNAVGSTVAESDAVTVATPPSQPAAGGSPPAAPSVGPPEHPPEPVSPAEQSCSVFAGGPGNDACVGGVGVDLMDGAGGGDTLRGEGGDDVLGGGSGDDSQTLDGGDGRDTLSGGPGDDRLLGGADRDFLSGDRGDDVIEGGGGSNIVDGGIGNDTIGGGGLVDSLNGGPDEDVIRGGGGDDGITGASGRDRLFGDAGDDRIEGGLGKDTIDGGAGGDNIVAIDGQADTVKCGPGRDIVRADGGDRVSRDCERVIRRRDNTSSTGAAEHAEALIRAGAAVDGAAAALPHGRASQSAEIGQGGAVVTGNGSDGDLAGGAGNDTIDSPLAGNRLLGGAGDDLLSGAIGDDTLDGADGTDELSGGPGDDTLQGGAERDYLEGGPGNDTLQGGDGSNILNGGIGNDTLQGGNRSDSLNGGSDEDTIEGGPGNDGITGASGRDKLLGQDGNDRIEGGLGKDTIDAGAGNDNIVAADGQEDTIKCGRGRDIVRADAGDTINRDCERVIIKRGDRYITLR